MFQLTTDIFQQPVDHHDPSGEVFPQQYHLLKPDGAAMDSPVFFVLGNETDATPEDLKKLYNAYGSPDDIIFMLAEHRGYGQSVTADEDQSLPSYLTIEQALADYHRFVIRFQADYTGPWIAAGYSYGGGLVINFAHSYPEDVRGILASSAVVDWPVFFPEYDRQIRINLGKTFYRRMASHTRNLQPKGLSDPAWIEREFLISMTIGISQMAEYQSLNPVLRLLSYLPTRGFVSILRWLDGIATKGMGWTSAASFGKVGLSRAEAITGDYNWYTWKYQQSRQTGTFFSSDSPDGLFAKSEADILDECRKMFGEDAPVLAAPRWNPRGMLRELKVPAVLTVGGRDPWTFLCHEKTDWIRDEDYFFVEEGLHCPDRDDPELGKRVLARMLSRLQN